MSPGARLFKGGFEAALEQAKALEGRQQLGEVWWLRGA